MSTTRQLTVPVIGMTCANCVASVERNSKKAAGVSEAAVNFASEKLTFSYDPALQKPKEVLAEVMERVEKAGYHIPTADIELPITGMTCANCVATVERTLNRLEGVVEATVNFANEKASVRYIPGTIDRGEMAAAVRKAGYDVVEAAEGEEAEDAEAAARSAEIRHQQTRLIVGIIFSLPLFLFSMSRDLGFLGHWAHDAWVNWLFLALATPVQFYVGWDYYTGAYKSLRNGSANMDVLVAMGSSVAYLYSVAVLIAKTLGSNALGDHVYFETSAVIITLIVLGKLLEAQAKGQTSAAIKTDGLAGQDGAGGSWRRRDGHSDRQCDCRRPGDCPSRREDSRGWGRRLRWVVGGRKYAHRREPARFQSRGRQSDRRNAE